MTGKLKKLAVLAAVAGALAALTSIAVLNVVSWLRGGDEPAPAQVIFILSGPPSRSLYAAELYNRGYAKEVYMARPVREYWYKLIEDIGVYFPATERMQRDVLLKKGVPAGHIHLIGDSCKNTIDEAEAAQAALRGKDCSLLIVTSPYHVKRAQMIFQDRMRSCRFRVVGTPYETLHEKWWTDQDSARNVILEVSKIIFYKLGGRFRGQEGHRTVQPAAGPAARATGNDACRVSSSFRCRHL